jgi:hypothetical protein
VTLSAGESLQADGTIVVSNPVVDFFDEAAGFVPTWASKLFQLPHYRLGVSLVFSDGVLLMAAGKCRGCADCTAS